jgi:hypothetical protein
LQSSFLKSREVFDDHRDLAMSVSEEKVKLAPKLTELIGRDNWGVFLPARSAENLWNIKPTTNHETKLR